MFFLLISVSLQVLCVCIFYNVTCPVFHLGFFAFFAFDQKKRQHQQKPKIPHQAENGLTTDQKNSRQKNNFGGVNFPSIKTY